MKINIHPPRRGKKVYYFEHKNGVLETKKAKSRYQAASGMLVALFMIGGVGALSVQVYQMRQPGTASATLQRQNMSLDPTKTANAEDNLKNADKKAREDEQLSKKIKNKLKNVPGGQKWSVYVRDVKTDRMAGVNADKELNASGLSNLLVTLPLESEFTSDKWNYRAGNTTVAKCVEALVRAAEENCRHSVDYYAKLKNSDAVFNGLGFKKTSLSDKEQKTSARDMGELLFRLQNSQGLSDKARRIVFDGLYGHKLREGIPASCKAECLVANITGESDEVRHDAAIVTVGASQYVVVIMTNGGSWSQIADVASQIQVELNP